MPYPERLKELLDTLLSIEEMDLRADLLIELAESFKPVAAEVASAPFPEEHRVPACESEVFIFATGEGNSLKYHFAVENPQGISAKALAAILDQTLSDEPCRNVLEVNEDFVHDVFGKQLSMGKGAGLMSMVSMIKAFAKRQLASLG